MLDFSYLTYPAFHNGLKLYDSTAYLIYIFEIFHYTGKSEHLDVLGMLWPRSLPNGQWKPSGASSCFNFSC